MTNGELLRRAAQRAGRSEFFLASLLLPYAEIEGLDEAGLPRLAGCKPTQIPALLLCRRPASGAAFADDVRLIAERLGVDPLRLAEVIRLAEAVNALGKAGAGSVAGLLAAARDRNEDTEH